MSLLKASGQLFKEVQMDLLKNVDTLPGVHILQIFFSHLREQLRIWMLHYTCSGPISSL